MFKIVKTIEDGEVFFTSVPSSWIRENFLYFPIGNWKKFRKEQRAPERDWTKIPYSEVRKEIYDNLTDALAAEKKIADFENTEEEETYLENKKTHRLHPARSIMMKEMKNNFDFNNEVKSTYHLSYSNPGSSPAVSGGSEEINNTSENNECFVFQDESLINATSHPSNIFDLKIPEISEVKQEVHEIHKKVEENSEEISKLHYEIIKLHSKADQILQLLNNRVTVIDNRTLIGLQNDINHNEVTSENELELFKFPIENTENMNLFETKLAEEEFFKKVFLKFSPEFSNTGYKWKQIAYILVDRIFKRQLLTDYSWTGISKNNTKKSFSSLVLVNRLFFQIVKKADASYTDLLHEEFFKMAILKYSSSRAKTALNAKRTSAPRTKISKSKLQLTLHDGERDWAGEEETLLRHDKTNNVKGNEECE